MIKTFFSGQWEFSIIVFIFMIAGLFIWNIVLDPQINTASGEATKCFWKISFTNFTTKKSLFDQTHAYY